jgi:hypothetical protein
VKLRTSLLTFLVASLATAGAAIPLGSMAASAAGPTATCTMGQYPVQDGAASSMSLKCLGVPGTAGTFQAAEKIQDFDNVDWFLGASRAVTGVLTANSVNVTVTAGVLNGWSSSGGSNGAIVINDVNKSITTKAGFLPAGDSIVSTGTGSIQLASKAKKSGTVILAIENGPGRTITDAVLADSSTQIMSASANFTSDDVGMSIGASNLLPGITISAAPVTCSPVTAGSTCATMNHPAKAYTSESDPALNLPLPCPPDNAAQPPTTGCAVGISDNNTREEGLTYGSGSRTTANRLSIDISYTINSASIVASTPQFGQADVGLPIVSVLGKVPKLAFILSVSNPTHAVMSANALATAVPNPGVKLVTTYIGNPSYNMPTSGVDTVSSLQTSLLLRPDLVSGSQPCSKGLPSGTLFEGVWNSPNTKTFLTAKHKASAVTIPLDYSASNLDNATVGLEAPAIGQINYSSSIVDFAGYVSYLPSGNAYNGNPHFEIAYPFLPTPIGVCPNSANASIFNFTGELATQFNKVPGDGRSMDVGGLRGIQSQAWVATGSPASVTGNGSVQGYDPFNAFAQNFNETGLTCTVVRPEPLNSFPCTP